MSSGYGEKSYWEQRYESSPDAYDWYLSYDELKAQLLQYVNVQPNCHAHVDADADADQVPPQPPPPPPNPSAVRFSEPPRVRSDVRVLMLGCGNSEMSRAMSADGFTALTAIDYSTVVIQQMKTAHQDAPNIKFMVMDARAMTFSAESFDVVIDKGTLDAVLCGADSSRNAELMLRECERVLAHNGTLIIITYGTPATRLPYLERSKWSWRVFTDAVGATRYMYVCRKMQTNSDARTHDDDAHGNDHANSNGDGEGDGDGDGDADGGGNGDGDGAATATGDIA